MRPGQFVSPSRGDLISAKIKNFNETLSFLQNKIYKGFEKVESFAKTFEEFPDEAGIISEERYDDFLEFAQQVESFLNIFIPFAESFYKSYDDIFDLSETLTQENLSLLNTLRDNIKNIEDGILLSKEEDAKLKKLEEEKKEEVYVPNAEIIESASLEVAKPIYPKESLWTRLSSLFLRK